MILVKLIGIVTNYTAPQGNPKGLHYCSPEVKTNNYIASKKFIKEINLIKTNFHHKFRFSID